MGFSKKPFICGVEAEEVHDSRSKVIISKPALSRSISYDSYHFSRNSILSIIVFTMLVILGFTIFNLIATPEFFVKKRIESIASDYYENYFYDSVPDHEALGIYEKTGLPRINLRQLLLYSDKRHATSLELFEKYCDLYATNIKIFPESPYARTNYHVEYTYSCNF